MALPTSVPMKLKKFDVQAPPPERQRSNCQVLDEASSPFSQELIKALYVTLLLVGSGLAGSGFEICRILMRVSSSNASALRDSTACGLGLRPCLLVIREALGFLGFGIRGFPSRNSSALAPPPPPPGLPTSSPFPLAAWVFGGKQKRQLQARKHLSRTVRKGRENLREARTG